MSTTTHTLYVVHSAYPDGTWRGIEKCSSGSTGILGPYLFDQPEIAKAYMEGEGMDARLYRVVLVTLTTPAVRAPLDTLEHFAEGDDAEPDCPCADRIHLGPCPACIAAEDAYLDGRATRRL